jgi:TolB-like protein
MSFFSDLKRRNVIRTALAYVVAAWLLIEVLEIITGVFEAPVWVMKVFISVLGLGIVPVLIFSWLYEITPDGIKREDADHPEHTAGTARKLDIAVLVMLTIAIGLFVQQRFSGESPRLSSTVEAPVTQGPPMVAVLPFASVSLEGDSGFFATGVHDDLLTQLAKMESMRVISRTSVLEYRDVKRNMREIGIALGADIILEGGVQTAGDRIRINAQLIDARTDEHLWAETYDRELSPVNIFDVQREIAQAIAKALNTTLTVQDNEQLAVIPTENMAAYRAYRRAMDIRYSSEGGVTEPDYIAALEEAVALDPAFIRAWAALVGILSLENVGLITPDPEITRRVEQALEHIRAVAPASAEYLIAQAYYFYYILKDYDHAYDFVTEALEKKPSDVGFLELKTWILRRQGKMDARTETLRQLERLDPRNPLWATHLIIDLYLTHRYDEAFSEIQVTTVDDDRVLLLRPYLELWENGNFEQFLQSIDAIYRVTEVKWKWDLWFAHIVNRDYSGARQTLDGFDLNGAAHSDYLPDTVWMGLLTYWLTGEETRLQEFISYARTLLSGLADDKGDFERFRLYLYMALVFAAEGNREETIAHIRRWEAAYASDITERMNIGDLKCVMLAMISETNSTVECLRSQFQQPSYTLPFLHPHLPFFDAMRNEPVFMEMMKDIEAGYYD